MALHLLIIFTYTSQIVGFEQFKVIFFGDVTDDVSDYVGSDLITKLYSSNKKGVFVFELK